MAMETQLKQEKQWQVPAPDRRRDPVLKPWETVTATKPYLAIEKIPLGETQEYCGTIGVKYLIEHENRDVRRVEAMEYQLPRTRRLEDVVAAADDAGAQFYTGEEEALLRDVAATGNPALVLEYSENMESREQNTVVEAWMQQLTD